MVKTEKCPECGSRYIGEGLFSGYANLTVKGRGFSSSKVIAQVCSNCGLILELRVDKPEKFFPKENKY
jgi:rRNA maturation protein Nop10